jgi:hypothetical protein
VNGCVSERGGKGGGEKEREKEGKSEQGWNVWGGHTHSLNVIRYSIPEIVAQGKTDQTLLSISIHTQPLQLLPGPRNKDTTITLVPERGRY